MPAMKIILTFLSDGSFNVLAMETKNASMASPIPSKMLLIKKESSRNIGCILPQNPVLNQKIIFPGCIKIAFLLFAYYNRK